MSKSAIHAATYVASIVEKDGTVRDIIEESALPNAIYALHDEVGDTHFGNRTDYEDGSWVREMLAGPKGPNADTTLVGIVRFFPATCVKSARKAKPVRKTARKSGRKAAEGGKPAVHFTAAQKKILLEGLKRFVNGLR